MRQRKDKYSCYVISPVLFMSYGITFLFYWVLSNLSSFDQRQKTGKDIDTDFEYV